MLVFFIVYLAKTLLVLSLLTLITLAILLLLVKLRAKWDTSPVCLVGKSVIVTGANSGIGFCTAREFAKRGAKVILACRSKTRAEAAKKKIVDETENTNVHVRIVDFCSFKSVRNFAKEINESEDRLDIMVNNAGAILHDEVTMDGFSQTMQVNSLGPYLLTLLLSDLLKRSGPSRIVNVSSLSVYFARLNLNNLNYYAHSFISRTFFFNYANAKLCGLILMNEMSRRLKGSGVTVNSVDPCIVFTEMARGWNITWNVVYACESILKYIFRTTEQGAQPSIYVSLSKQIENVTGKYFRNSSPCEGPRIAHDKIFAKKLWDTCISLLQLTDEERLKFGNMLD